MLAEIVLTSDKKKQTNNQEKVYDWYTSKIKVPVQEIPETIKEKNNFICIPIPNVVKNSRKNYFFPYVPKKEIEEKVDLDIMSQKYSDMITNEKISLGCSKSRNNSKKVNKSNDLVLDSKNFNVKIDSKIGCKTPEIKDFDGKSPFSHDFRAVSHKSRVITPTKGPTNFFSEFYTKDQEINEITKIKAKLAERKIPVSIYCLENALSTHKKLPFECLTPDNWPKGGESLIKFPSVQKNSRKGSLTKKVKKKSMN